MASLSYAEMLAATDPETVGGTLEPGSPAEDAALERFCRFFSDLTPERVERECREVYAPGAILHDTLVTHRGIDAIEPYFLATAKRARSVTVTVDQTLREGVDYYVRWTMDITWSAFREKGKTTRSVGMSHLRFDPSGRVVLHHDFWDSAGGFFQHLPAVGALIRWVKRRVAKVSSDS